MKGKKPLPPYSVVIHPICTMYAQIFWIGANVMGANISLAQTFHGRKHFMGANISWAQIFHGRKYFVGAKISWAQIF